MRRKLYLSSLVSWMVGAAVSAHAAEAVVEVSYTPPARGGYTDAGDTPMDTERAEKDLARHLQQLGARWLPPDSTMKVNVTDIDLAGRIPPGSMHRTRVLGSGADWPRIEFSYELVRADGQAERGEARVNDMNYLMTQPRPYANEPLAYERRMLDDWFRQRFAPKAL